MTDLLKPTPAPPVSVQQTTRDLAEAKAAAMIARADLAVLSTLEARVAWQTTQTLIDDTNRPHLIDAADALRKAREDHARHAVLARTVDELTATLGEALHQQRMAAITQANERLSKATARFDNLAREACRSYRDLLTAQQASQRTPGAATDIPTGMHFPHLTPAGWQGMTSDHIRDNSLPWLRGEHAEAA